PTVRPAPRCRPAGGTPRTPAPPRAAPCPGPGDGRPTRPAVPEPPGLRAPPGRSCTRPAPATASRPGPTRCGPAAGTGPRCRPCSAAASTASTHTRDYAAKPAITRTDCISACIYEPCTATAAASRLACPFTPECRLGNRPTAEA